MSDEAPTCVWDLRTEHGGEVQDRDMFGHQIRVQICDKHFHEHLCIAALHKQGQDIDEVLSKGIEHVVEEVQRLEIDLTTIEP